MKKLFLCLSLLLLLANRSDCAVTTIDGAITLDFYEDTQFGNNRWILDMKVNDFDGPGGVEAIAFDIWIWNNQMTYNNEYNITSEYYVIGGYYPMPGFDISIPVIATDMGQLLTPVNTNYIFYAIPNNNYYQSNINYIPIIGNFDIDVNGQRLQLTGPIGFNVIPEPIGILLFLFGVFLLKIIVKRQ